MTEKIPEGDKQEKMTEELMVEAVDDKTNEIEKKPDETITKSDVHINEMKIIESKTSESKNVFSSLFKTPVSDMRNIRRVIAEDPEWSLATVPLLVELCLQHIAENFGNNSLILKDMLTKHQLKVLENISVNIPLKVTANLIDNEHYWKRCCMNRWEICDISNYKNGWKQMYIEKNLEYIIENFVPGTTDPTELNETIELSGNYIRKLDIHQLLPPVNRPDKPVDFGEDASESDSDIDMDSDHFTLFPVVTKLPLLEELHVTYSVKDCGMNFEWGMFYFTKLDCQDLAETIAISRMLKKFKLYRSRVDDEKVRILVSYMMNLQQLVELDLSHNCIGDHGAKAIGKFLCTHPLVKLNLSNNLIHGTGGQAIAHALLKTVMLKSLNLRLNRLGDEGGQAICKALTKNETLEEINIAANEMGEPTAALMSQVLLQNSTLKSIDFSCNKIGVEGGKGLQDGIEENNTIILLDLRLTDCSTESEFYINQKLFQNQEQELAMELKWAELKQAK